MSRGKGRKRHTVTAELHVRELTKAGSSLTLDLYAKREKLGEMVIGRGSLFWYGRKRKNGKRIPWSRFAEMMDQLAYGS